MNTAHCLLASRGLFDLQEHQPPPLALCRVLFHHVYTLLPFHLGSGDYQGRHATRYDLACVRLSAALEHADGQPDHDSFEKYFHWTILYPFLQTIRRSPTPRFQFVTLEMMPIEIIGNILDRLPNGDLAAVRVLSSKLNDGFNFLRRREFSFNFDCERKLTSGPLTARFRESLVYWNSDDDAVGHCYCAQLRELAYRCARVQDHSVMGRSVTHVILSDVTPMCWTGNRLCFGHALLGFVVHPLLLGFPSIRRVTMRNLYVPTRALLCLADLPAVDQLTLEYCTVYDPRVANANMRYINLRQLNVKVDTVRPLGWRCIWNATVAAPRLEVLCIAAGDESKPFGIAPPRHGSGITLPALKALILIGSQPSFIPALVDWLVESSPVLERLHLKAPTHLTFDVRSVVQMITPWATTLRVLAVEGVELLNEDILENLGKALPALRYLSIGQHRLRLEDVIDGLGFLRGLEMFRCNAVAADGPAAKTCMAHMRVACETLRYFALGRPFEGDDYRGFINPDGEIELVTITARVLRADVWEDLDWAYVSYL